MESKLDVATCIENMNTISARKYRECGRLTEITKRCRTICETLNVPIPEGVRENMEITARRASNQSCNPSEFTYHTRL